MYTTVGRNQHTALLDTAAHITDLLNIDELMVNASQILDLITELAGKLDVHLAMEDEILYPKLLKQSDEKIQSITKDFIAEMGGIENAFHDYQKKWSNYSEIQNDPERFIKRTKAVFNVLAERIKKEEQIMYKIIDDLM